MVSDHLLASTQKKICDEKKTGVQCRNSNWGNMNFVKSEKVIKKMSKYQNIKILK